MSTETYRIGRFTLLPTERQLLADGHPARIGARAFDLLLALVERHGRTVTRRELFELVWPGRVVEDQNLQVQVVALRKLLGTEAIATIPGRGYRLALPVDPAPGTTAAQPVIAAAPAKSSPRAGNLPADLPGVIGREADLATVRESLRDQRLVTIVGAGGIGKTRLALAAAASLQAEFRDGAWLVELASVSDAPLIAGTVARALGFSPGTELTTHEGVARALAGMSALLLLDNCEHLVEAAGAFAHAVLRAAPGVRVLATSQEPLHVPGEQVFRLGALAVPPASLAQQALAYGSVALFVERARAATPGFVLDDQGALAASEICRRLDGIPLAIELAAARVPLLGVEGVRARLDERFRLLTGGARTAPTRHQTLGNALEWSHSLLSAPERAVFRRLAVFAGSFSLASAQQVAGDRELDEWSVLDQLGALVDKSLVAADSGAEPRYRMLESARAFALGQLDASGETLAVRRRHATSILAAFERAEDFYLTVPTLEWMADCLPDLDNWREALAFSVSPQGEPGISALLAAAAAPFMAVAGLGTEGAAACVAARNASGGSLSPDTAARLALGRAQLGVSLAVPPPEALEAAAQAAAYFRGSGDVRRLYRALASVALCAEWTGAVERIEPAIMEMRQLEGDDWPVLLTSLRRQAEARLLRRQGRIAEHRDASLAEARRCEHAGEVRSAWAMRHNAALAEISLGNVASAMAIMAGVREAILRRGLQREFWIQVAMYALVCIESGDLRSALPAVREAIDLLRAQRALWWLGDHLAWVPALRQEWAPAALVQGWADARAAERGVARGAVMQAARDRLAQRLEDAIGREATAQLRSDGATLADDEVIRLVLPP